jgi:hypothetical protein
MKYIAINEREKTDLFRYSVFRNILRNQKVLNGIRVFLLFLVIYAILWGLFYPKNEFTTGLFWGLFWPFFIILTLSTFGNIFCMICPHGYLVRKISSIGLKKRIPKILKNPYIGFSLLIILYWFVLYSFPGFWRSSFNTALLFLFFTLLAIIISFFYTNGAYCKYFCPIGRVLSAFNRVGFLWLSSYKNSCSTCDKPTCAFSCHYKLNPSKFDKNNSMETCTLCMECATSCEAVKYSAKGYSHSLLKEIPKPQNWEIWVYISFLAVISIAMKFHHGLGHSPIKHDLPWVIVGNWLKSATGIGKPFDFVGFTALIFAIVSVLVLVLGGFFIASKIINKPFKDVFLNLGYALAPLMIIGSLSHALQFFFLHYYHDIINGFSQAFFLSIKVEPLASRKDLWLKIFYIFPFLAVFWSSYIMWKRLDFFKISGMKKYLSFLFASSIILFYLGLTILQLAVRYIK